MQTIVEIDGTTLIIKLPLQKPVRSKSSGKTLVIASSHGTVTSPVRYRGKQIVVVANAFVYPGRQKRARRPTRKPGPIFSATSGGKA